MKRASGQLRLFVGVVTLVFFMRFSFWFSLGLCSFQVWATEPVVSIASRGRLLFEDPMTQVPDKDWRVINGEWTVQGEVWRVSTIPADKHGPTIRHALPASDVVIEIEFRFGKMKDIHLALNDDKGHISRVLVEPGALVVRKDSYGHKNDEELMRIPQNLAPDQWHTLVVELKEDQILARVGEGVAQGTHPDLAKPKTQFALGFGNGDNGVEVRRFRIWEAE